MKVAQGYLKLHDGLGATAEFQKILEQARSNNISL